MRPALAIQRIMYRVLEAGWQHWRYIAYPALILPLMALLIGFILPKTYEIQTTILFQEPSKINPFMQDISIDANIKERMSSINALLHSRHVLTNVLRDLKIIQKDHDARHVANEVDRLSSTLSAELEGDGLVTIRVRHTDPMQMSGLLEAVSRRFVEKVLAPAWVSLTNSEEFLDRELTESRKRLEKSENALADFKSKHSEELPMLHASNVARLAKIQTDLSEKRSQFSGAQGALKSLKSRLVQTNPVIGRLEEQIIRYSGELALLKARYTDQHSKVKGVQRALTRLQTERRQLLNNGPDKSNETVRNADQRGTWNVTVDNNQTQPLLVAQMEQMEMARVQVTTLEKEIGVLERAEIDLQSKVRNFGSIERTLQGLERQTKVRRDMHEQMMQRAEMASITGNLSKFEVPSRVKMIDRPFKPPYRVSPLPLPVFGLAGFFGGIMLGVGVIAMQEVANTSVRYPHQLVRLMNVPVLLSIAPQPALDLWSDESSHGDINKERKRRFYHILRKWNG